MKNNFSRIILIILSLAIALSVFAGCQKIDNKPDTSSQPQGSNAEDSLSPEEDETSSQPEDTTENNDDEWSDVDEDTEDQGILDIKTKVNNLNPLSQRYMGSGTGVYFCYPYIKDNYGRNATDEQLQIEFDRLQNMNIHTVRTLFNFLWVRDETAPGGWNWESDDMKAVYRWMGEMQKRDIDVMLNPWSFTWITGGSSSIPDTDYFHTDNYTENSTRWSNAVTELFKQMYARGYNNAKYLVLFTEPITPKEISEDMYNKYIENALRLHETLTKAGIRKNIKVVGPNRADDNTDLLIRCYNEADDAFDIYSHHRYINSANLASDLYGDNAMLKWGSYVSDMKEAGMGEKPYWVDEWGIQDDSQTGLGFSNVGFDEPLRGVQQAVAITVGMNLGIDNMLLWTLANQQWPNQRNTGYSSGFYDGVIAHGIFDNIQDTLMPKHQYYSYSLLSKFTGRGGGKTYYSAPYEEYEYMGVSIACMQTSEGDWTVIVTNTNPEDVRISVDFEKSLGGIKLYRHQYVAYEVKPNIAAQIIPANKTIADVTTNFTDILRSFSVAVYTTDKLN